jgi:hypothetical protein
MLLGCSLFNHSSFYLFIFSVPLDRNCEDLVYYIIINIIIICVANMYVVTHAIGVRVSQNSCLYN